MPTINTTTIKKTNKQYLLEGYFWPTKRVKRYFHPGLLSDILTIANP